MTEVNQDEKQKAKAAATKAAINLNDASLLYGAAAAVVGVAGAVSLVGAAPAAVVAGGLAVCAFAIGVVGNRYQRLANDPPRTDFDVVTVSAASFTGPATSDGDFEASAVSLAAHHIILSDALDALVTSIERYDGATAAGNGDAATSQATAAGQNVAAAKAALAIVVDTATSMNAAWSAATDADWTTANLPDVQSRYLAAAGPPGQAPGQPLTDVMATVANLANPSPFDSLSADQDPVLSATAIPPRPDLLFPQAALDSLNAAADSLDGLVDEGGGQA